MGAVKVTVATPMPLVTAVFVEPSKTKVTVEPAIGSSVSKSLRVALAVKSTPELVLTSSVIREEARWPAVSVPVEEAAE